MLGAGLCLYVIMAVHNPAHTVFEYTRGEEGNRPDSHWSAAASLTPEFIAKAVQYNPPVFHPQHTLCLELPFSRMSWMSGILS